MSGGCWITWPEAKRDRCLSRMALRSAVARLAYISGLETTAALRAFAAGRSPGRPAPWRLEETLLLDCREAAEANRNRQARGGRQTQAARTPQITMRPYRTYAGCARDRHSTDGLLDVIELPEREVADILGRLGRSRS